MVMILMVFVSMLFALVMMFMLHKGDRRDFCTDFHELHARPEAVAQFVEEAFEAFAGSQQQFRPTHFSQVFGGWLEMMNIGAGLEDFDDLHIRTTDLLREIGQDGMQRGDFGGEKASWEKFEHKN